VTRPTKDVIGTNMYLDAMSKQAAAIQNTPEAAKGISENTQRLAAATVNIPERQLKEINQQFAELKLTDLWKDDT
jgi:precorrin-6B methylase 2